MRRVSERLNPHFGVRRCKPFEILPVSRKDVSASCFYGMGHDKRVDGVSRVSRCQKSPRGASMNLARLGYGADCLQHAIDGSVARSAADRLGHDDHRNLDGRP
jgi:hypothetical protein